MSISLATRGMIVKLGIGVVKIIEEIDLTLGVAEEIELAIIIENEIEITVEVCDA